MNLFILPVHKEPDILKTLQELTSYCERQFPKNYNMLLIDDGAGEEFNLIKETDKIRKVKNMFDRGKGSALKTGYVLSCMIYALRDDDNIIFMDSDGQFNPTEITTFLNLMHLYNADVSVGNKRHAYSNIDYTRRRRFISSTYNNLVRILFKLNYKDTQCGLKIFKKYVLDSVIEKVTIKRYAFDIELIVAIKELRFRIVDAPVNLRKQLNAGSVTVENVIRTFIDTLIVWYKSKKGYYSQQLVI